MPPTNVPTPQPNDPNQSSPISKLPKWAKLSLALGGVVLILAIALGIGSKFYYQVSPLPAPNDQTPPLNNSNNSQNTAAFDQALASASVASNPQQQCFYFSADDPSYSLSTSTLEQMGPKLCTLFVEKGAAIIQHPLTAGSPSVYHGGGGAYNGLGIVVSDQTYLISFSLFNNQSSQYQITLNHATILKTIKVSSITAIPVQSSVADSQLIKIMGTDALGKPSEEYFGESYERYSDGGFSVPVTKNSNGSFSNLVSWGNDTDPAKGSFLIPYTPSAVQTTSDRDFQMELQNNTSPIYHKATCGLEESYGDMAFDARSYQTTIAINFGYSPSLHITTAVQGYVPEQWGKILKDVVIGDFRAVVQEAAATRSTAKVEMLTISGYTVKHIGPIMPDRTCQYQQNYTYDMYQTIKNGAVITFTVTHDNSGQSNASTDIQKLIGQVLTTLTFSPR